MRAVPGFRVRFDQPPPVRSLAERLRDACDAASFGRELVAINVRLRTPLASDDELRDAVLAWLHADPPDDGGGVRRVLRPGLL